MLALVDRSCKFVNGLRNDGNVDNPTRHLAAQIIISSSYSFPDQVCPPLDAYT